MIVRRVDRPASACFELKASEDGLTAPSAIVVSRPPVEDRGRQPFNSLSGIASQHEAGRESQDIGISRLGRLALEARERPSLPAQPGSARPACDSSAPFPLAARGSCRSQGPTAGFRLPPSRRTDFVRSTPRQRPCLPQKFGFSSAREVSTSRCAIPQAPIPLASASRDPDPRPRTRPNLSLRRP